ncbi:Kelch repeat-containing protein [Tieghemostelium lacteum]|uniref:Kelch repeat-containing protein n=1 Tax=Tieghemostelium lacteum TaxID=361077 RepID=A0A152A4G7_TIELA|nr:Kelch repeat-containing protein [Tieghemostelium lacteum]|eukprot:KYR01119.1 Kelch repeat-containing protein [Tieghemostelium lacteum]
MINNQNNKDKVDIPTKDTPVNHSNNNNNNNNSNTNNNVIIDNTTTKLIETEIQNNNTLIEELKSSKTLLDDLSNSPNSSQNGDLKKSNKIAGSTSTLARKSNDLLKSIFQTRSLGFGLTFIPLVFVQTVLIGSMIYFIGQSLSIQGIPLYLVAVVSVYLVLYLTERLRIRERVTGGTSNHHHLLRQSFGLKKSLGVIQLANGEEEGEDEDIILLSSDNPTLQSPSFRNKYNRDVKSMINFYETKNRALKTHLRSMSLNSQQSQPQQSQSQQSQSSSLVPPSSPEHNGGFNSTTHTIHQSYTTFPTHTFDLDPSTTYRNRFRNTVNRKTLPPDYYNQYLNYLIHENNPQPPPTSSSHLATPLPVHGLGSSDNENEETLNEQDSDISSTYSNSSNTSSQYQSPTQPQLSIEDPNNHNNNIKETKEELSQLENSKKVKSTINHFTKLSTGVEEKLDWTLATCSLSPPRASHTVTVYGQSLVLIGGEGLTDQNSNFIQFIDPERNITITPKITGSKSAPESIHSHDYCRIGNKLYLYGGLVAGKPSNKLFVLTIIDDSTVHWSQPRVNGSSPKPRYGHTLTRFGNRFILFGGYDDQTSFNDLNLLDPETMTWSSLETTGLPPSERYGHTTTILGEKLIIFGGKSSLTNKEFNDVHILQLDTFSWIQPIVHQNLEIPPERSHHSATRVGRNLIIVGGKREGVTLRDIWILSYKMQWSKVTGATPIPPHSHHALIKNGSKLFILGGKGSGNAGAPILDDIWFVNTVTLPITSSVQMVAYPDIKIEKEIGKGHFSKVWRGTWKGKDVAVKKINIIKEKGKEEIMNEFKSEVELLGTLQHPNLVTCYGYSLNPMCIVMEFLPTGNLFELIHAREHKLDSTLILQFAFDIARGMQHLHSRSIIHRDLKSSNLLLDKHFNVKIADLGIARETSFTQTMTTIGTVAWTAPEILRHESYNQKADVYSYAIVIWELLTGEEPYAGMPAMNAGILVASKELRPELPENCDPNWKKLVSMCWAEDPNKRPSFEDITNYLTKTF